MLCENCKKNEATVFVHENLNGKKKSFSLCADCAKEFEKKGELNLGTPSFFSQDDHSGFNSIFESLFDTRHRPTVPSGKKCPLCNATYAELAKEGKVGCPECYETFSTELERTIAGIHSNAVHTGHIPSRLRGQLDVKRRIRALEAELKEAISDERYERAAEIRDELNTLRGQ